MSKKKRLAPKRDAEPLAPLPELSRARALVCAVALALPVVLAYSNTFSVPFVYDDVKHITGQPLITRLSTCWAIMPTP